MWVIMMVAVSLLMMMVMLEMVTMTVASVVRAMQNYDGGDSEGLSGHDVDDGGDGDQDDDGDGDHVGGGCDGDHDSAHVWMAMLTTMVVMMLKIVVVMVVMIIVFRGQSNEAGQVCCVWGGLFATLPMQNIFALVGYSYNKQHHVAISALINHSEKY